MQINDTVMVLGKWTPKSKIAIWHPRYHDQRVLINPAKVAEHNHIVFSKAPSLPGDYYLSGKTIRKYKKESNGTIDCWSVPVRELRPLQIDDKDLKGVW